MTDSELLNELLTLAHAGRFEDISKLPGADDHSSVCRFSAEARKKLNTLFRTLDISHQNSLVKAIAVYENTVGGLGSVTLLRGLMELVQDSDRSLLDWILRNTNSFSYYSGSVKSIEEYENLRSIATKRREENLQKEKLRESEAKHKKAVRATSNLFNAVRRGDIKAVAALLDQGANPNFRTPDGMTLIELADANGRRDISTKLKEWVTGV